MPIIDRSLIDALPKQEISLPPPVLGGMLGSETYRSFVPVLEQEGAPFYQVTVRNLAQPEKLVLKDRALNNLQNWQIHFRHDVFSDVVETSTWKFPLLRKSDEFYSIIFSDPKHRKFEVSVCPVLSQQPLVKGYDLIRVFVAPPELAPTHEEKLKSTVYPRDITNIELCRRRFPNTMRDSNDRRTNAAALNGAAGNLGGDFTVDELRMLRRKQADTEIVSVPAYWDFVFVSKHGNERTCGAKSVPQVLGKLWFLRDGIVRGAKCKIVKLNQMSYVGYIENVSGFNVFFQVNCSMRMQSLLRFFQDAQMQVPWTKRSIIPYRAMISVVETRSNPAGQRGGITYDLSKYTEVMRGGMRSLDAAMRAGDTESIERWQRVVEFTKATIRGLSTAWKKATERDTLRAIVTVASTFLESYAPERPAEYSHAFKVRLADAAYETRAFVLRVALEDMDAGDIINFLQRVRNDTEISAVVAKTDPSDAILHIREGAMTLESAKACVLGTVPAVFASVVDLALYAYAFPEGLDNKYKADYFDSTNENRALVTARQWWVSRTALQRSGEIVNLLSGRSGTLTLAAISEGIALDISLDSLRSNIRAWTTLVSGFAG